MPRLSHVAFAGAALGVVIPVAIMLINSYIDLMWWPQWILFVWPTSFMLIATSAIINAFFFKIAAISVAVNALLYALNNHLIPSMSRRGNCWDNASLNHFSVA